jgi:hypothetical protein
MADFIHSCHKLYSNPKLFVKLSASVPLLLCVSLASVVFYSQFIFTNQIELLCQWSDRGSGRAIHLLSLLAL